MVRRPLWRDHRYEAVHEIGDWDELRRRLDPEDRRCFAFFHPQLVDEPLIFVEVALTRSMSGSISELLSETRAPIRAEDATTAVFYSISNCQDGLRGISFGNFLIKQVVEELRRDLPRLETFVTLSPMSGFLSGLLRRGTRRRARSPTRTAPRWRRSRIPNGPPIPARGRRSKLRSCPQPRNTFCTPATSAACRSIRWPAFISAMARGSSASTSSPIGRRPPWQSHGIMVNYLYKLDDIEANHEAFIERAEVVAAPSVKRLVRNERRQPEPGRQVERSGQREMTE